MSQTYKPYSTKFGIKLDNTTPFLPSFSGVCLLLILHFAACVTIWCLDWHFIACLLMNLGIVFLMIRTIDRCIFKVLQYQVRFFFEDKEGWIIQENENTCYRAVLKFAFCSKYLVIMTFIQLPGFTGKCLKKRLVLPIFFDSLPAYEFRQLRKTLILLGYV